MRQCPRQATKLGAMAQTLGDKVGRYTLNRHGSTHLFAKAHGLEALKVVQVSSLSALGSRLSKVALAPLLLNSLGIPLLLQRSIANSTGYLEGHVCERKGGKRSGVAGDRFGRVFGWVFHNDLCRLELAGGFGSRCGLGEAHTRWLSWISTMAAILNHDEHVRLHNGNMNVHTSPQEDCHWRRGPHGPP